MEAEILALLVEGIMVKQFLQFFLGDEGGLESNQQVEMRLNLDSTSAQSFFNRLGKSKAFVDTFDVEPTGYAKEMVSGGENQYPGKSC